MEVTGRFNINDLANVNWSRCKAWHEDGDEWTLADWATAMAGECGEACNIVKKMRRIQTGVDKSLTSGESYEELKEKLAEELADTFLYLDLLATAAGVLLDEAVSTKFNSKSVDFGFPHRLEFYRG